MDAHLAVDPGALDANDYTEVGGQPSGICGGEKRSKSSCINWHINFYYFGKFLVEGCEMLSFGFTTAN